MENRASAGEWLPAIIEDGDAIPKPSTLDNLAEDPAREGAVAFLVHVEPEAERTVRINITAREKQVEEIDKLANEAGLTRSAYMVQSALHHYPGPGRPGRVKHAGRSKARQATE